MSVNPNRCIGAMAMAVLCVIVLLQLLFATECYQSGGGIFRGGRKLELLNRNPADADLNTNVMRSVLVHRDDLRTSTSSRSRSERFLDAVKRSRIRVTELEKKLRTSREEQVQAARSLEGQVSAGSGEYVLQISLGTPPQQFSAIVDTGSDLCWVQCAPCARCFEQPDPLFIPLASSSYSNASCTDSLCDALPRPTCSMRNTCTYSYSYGDGSNTRGDFAFETVTLNGSTLARIGFGCGHNQEGTFAGADGLIGLGQGPLSLPSQLNSSFTHIFSYCLVDQSTTGTFSPITFGNAAENSRASFTPLLQNEDNPSYYYVGVESISVGNRRVPTPPSAFRIDANGVGGVILDSGTTITYWRLAAFIPILAELRRQISYPEADPTPYGLNLCYDISSVSASSLTLPSMTVHLTNVDFEIPVSNLWVLVDNFGETVCTAMSTSDQFSIIGNVQQQNNLIVTDVANSRVGFLATDCSTL
ncbi:aspartic proteinase nepenthesin-1 [Physcomitrium patens]|uniref:Peptidase A1 domain-containing protein n=1 Tax=Physcomitrium patens TaxID=3218 RepID=A0A2K1KWE0_PHYPA|nr:aspartic proteinase nepenthesin-1-like [Physcomitrium patens]XP_024370146.1 aspartic proteinase nepenthesin-1-like [Physcomitrium patens]XP_024370147.1 aspartic proteinase nepenthesin-1-like [Physcomitrium patens]PNR58088.1 hypothetical protein PHYPA_005083 [Physcomitrium patens]|eukprot:XP_024370145.1 aspartic proteinase nepenthesin-1-like [Physcomitrella patens]